MNCAGESKSCPNPVDATGQEALIAFLDRAIAVLDGEGGAAQDFEYALSWLAQRRVIWTSHAWRLALIGITSSGKSTFVNALMGAALLPTGVPPSSNIIICCRRCEGSEAFCRVRYKGRSISEDFHGREAIADVLAALGDERRNPNNHLGVQEIDLFSPDLPFSEDVILIDTPGLDAYGLQCHEELTLNLLLPTVDAVIFLQMLKPASGYQLHRILEIVFSRKKPLIFVQTAADSVDHKKGLDHSIQKSKDQIKGEHKEIARKLLEKAGYPAATPIVQVSALSHLRGDKENSGIETLVTAVKGHLSILGPELIKGRFQQLETELRRIAKVDITVAEIQDSRRRVAQEREGLLALSEKSKAIISALRRSLAEKVTTARNMLSEVAHAANALGYGESDCHGARKIIEKFENAVRESGNALSASVQETERAIQALARPLNLSEEDMLFRESPSRRVPSIRIPKSVREVNDSGFWSGVKRFFGAGGKHHEEHLKADEFRQQLREHSEEQLRWMEKDAKPAVIANAIERSLAITKEVDRQLGMLEAEEKSQLTHEARLTVASALQELIAEMPHASVAKVDFTCNDVSSQSEETSVEIEISPLTEALLCLAGSVPHYRFICVRNKALALVAKRTGEEAVRRVLVFGFDTDSIERFLNCFWNDFPDIGNTISSDFTDIRARPPFEAVAICKQKDGESAAVSEKVAKFLSAPATLFLMMDLEQIGTAMNQIDRSHILKQLRPDIGFVLVVQSVKGMFNAQTLSEGIIHLRHTAQCLDLKVDAVLVNSNETFFSTAMDSLFERDDIHATLQDEQEFLEALRPNGPREEQIAKQILHGWRNYRTLTE